MEIFKFLFIIIHKCHLLFLTEVISLHFYFIVKRIFDEKLEKPFNDCLTDVSKSDEFNRTIIL